MASTLIIPDELRFAVTRKCDGKCLHCYNQSGRDTDCLKAIDFIQLIQEIHELNPNFDRITITGGEPLKEPDTVIKITEFANSLGIRVRLVTRGWELTPEISAELKIAGVSRVQIGLDSSGEYPFVDDSKQKWDSMHSWLRGDEEGFRNTVSAIKIAIKSGLDVSVRFSLCRSNLNDVVDTYRFVSTLGVSKFKLRVLFPDGRAKHRLIRELVEGNEMADAQYSLIQAAKKNLAQVEITQPCLFSLPSRSGLLQNGDGASAFKEFCPCGTVAAYIDSNGDVKYCLFDEQALGNLRGGSFLNVWNSALAGEARAHRCPLDLSGSGCSAFKLLYSQFFDYGVFLKSYVGEVRQKNRTNQQQPSS